MAPLPGPEAAQKDKKTKSKRLRPYSAEIVGEATLKDDGPSVIVEADSSMEGAASANLVKKPEQEQEPASSKRKRISQPESPEVTPPKKGKDDKKETPEKEPMKSQTFGGKSVKADRCNVCEHERDASQRGATCDFCFQRCRQKLKHQRISEVLANEDLKAELKAGSLADRALKSENARERPLLDQKTVEKFLKVMERLVKYLPRLEGLIDKVEDLANVS